MNTYDVIIAGAGPAGLFLAGELAEAKCSVLILEKAEDPHSPLKLLPFGIRGLNAPSIEALHRRGLLDQLELHKRLQNPFSGARGKQAGHFAGIPFEYANIDTERWPRRAPDAPPTHLLAELAELEAVLTRRALALGVDIRRGLAVDGVEQSGDGAMFASRGPRSDDAAARRVERGGGVAVRAGGQLFRAGWLIGCDGARSVVRKAGGFTFEGTEPAFTGYSAKVDIADPEKLAAGRVTTPQGMYFQSQPGYLNMQDFDGGASHQAHQAGQPLTRERLQTVLRRISGTGVTISALHIATTWTDRARQATSYRNGRILLAGDAAHIHSPLGGQGLNLGLGDAANLGWKLAATIHGTAPEGLLDSYHAERHPIGAKVLDWSRAQVAVMRPTPEGRALNAIFRDLVNTRDGATYFAGRVWGIGA
ncbi:FAD-dependent monooxygenase [Duganella radicis]|uniref:FAD-dependent oxidoreductase n=1 Tax=Duganella radicis TaxID=551988 RepID=A0A6L6PCV7_9BURK|nr:FAD-dependent monooxygenase [Duganella radicis]MTV36922.1 FAD-dependent oxidoreductase [Duganella radicis]